MDVRDILSSLTQQDRNEEAIQQLIVMAGWKGDPRILGLTRLAQRTGNWAPLVKLLRQRFGRVEKFHPLVEVPSAADVAGEVLIGNLVLPDWTLGPRVGLKREHLNLHGIIAGPPGKGKTWTGKALSIQWHYLGARSLILDADRQFFDLPLFLPKGEAIVLDLAQNELKRNIWQPLPRGTFEENESRLRAVFNEVWVGPGGGNILSDLALDMHAEGGQFTMSQIFERLKRLRGRIRDSRRLGYLEGVISPVSNLVNHLRQGYDVLEGYPLDELLDFSIVLDVRDLATDLAAFVNVELLSAIGKLTLREPPKRPIFILWDEAQRLLKAAGHAQTVEGEPVLFEFFRGARKRDAGVWVMTHLASEIPPEVSGNVATHIYFQTSDGGSVEAIARSHSLTSEQQRFIPEIPDRCALMKHPNFPKPFLVRIAELNLESGATFEQVAEMVKPFIASLTWTPSSYTNTTTAANKTQPSVERNVARSEDRDEARHSDNGSAVGRDVESAMSSDLLDYLEEIGSTPFEAATERDKRLQVSLGVGNARRAKFAVLGLIKEHQVRLVRRGSPTKLLEITDKGWAVLEQYKRRTKKAAGRGSFIHQFWQHKIAEHVGASLPNAKVSIEDQTTGKAVDVLVRADNKVIGIEISETTRPEDELRNVVADLGFCDLVFVLAEGERHLQSIKELVSQELSGQDWNRVRFSTLVGFCNSPPSFEAKLL